MSIEEAIIGCKDIMQVEEGGNGSEGVIVKFYNDNFVMCLVQLYKQVNPTATEAMLTGMLQKTYMDIFSMESKVSVIARKYSRDVELKVATQYKLLPGSKTIIVENEEAFFGHGTSSDEPISNIVGFILEI